LLDGRFIRAGILTAVALFVHPLMTASALFVGAAFVASARWKTERLAVVGAVAACCLMAIAAIPAVGGAAFGRMDAEWMRSTQIICHQCFVTTWSANEWCRTSIALMIVLAVRSLLPPLPARLVFWVAFTAVAGLVVTAYAQWTQYAFLIQGQAFRALWLAELLAYPLGLVLIEKLWQEDAARKLMAVAIAAYVMQPFVHGSMMGTVALDTIGLWVISSLCVGACIHAWSRRNNQNASLGLAVLVGMLGMSAFISAARFLSFVVFANHSTERISLLWSFAAHAMSVAVIAAASLTGVVLLIRRKGLGWQTGSIAVATWLVLGAVPFTVDSLRFGEKRFAQVDRDLAFVKSHLASQAHSASRPQIYWPADPSPIWLDLQATSYYSWYQTWGIIFSEELLEVAAHRAELSRRFEVDWMRKAGLPESLWIIPLEMLQTDFNEPAPERQDLLRLAQDPTLDWIVCKHEFDGLTAASNGSVHIYDARKLRETSEVAARTQ
jgi:hypothetical protein